MSRERIRTVKPEWRTDQKLGRAGLAARVLSIALVTLADDEGRGEWREHVLAADVFGFEREPLATCRDAVAKLSRWYLRIYEVRGETYFQIVNWTRHQKVDKARPSRLPAPPPEDEPPQNTPENDDSRHPRENLATSRDEIATSRDNLGPGPGTWDHGPGTGERPAAPSRETPDALDPLPSALLDRGAAALRKGYGDRYKGETSEMWMGGAKAHTHIIACAAWVIAKGEAQIEPRARALLDGVFADPWMRQHSWPWGNVANDPARYARDGAGLPGAAPLAPANARYVEMTEALNHARTIPDNHAEIDRLKREIDAYCEAQRQRRTA